jgi:hypothetical protein
MAFSPWAIISMLLSGHNIQKEKPRNLAFGFWVIVFLAYLLA